MNVLIDRLQYIQSIVSDNTDLRGFTNLFTVEGKYNHMTEF